MKQDPFIRDSHSPLRLAKKCLTQKTRISFPASEKRRHLEFAQNFQQQPKNKLLPEQIKKSCSMNQNFKISTVARRISWNEKLKTMKRVVVVISFAQQLGGHWLSSSYRKFFLSLKKFLISKFKLFLRVS